MYLFVTAVLVAGSAVLVAGCSRGERVHQSRRRAV